MESKRCFKAKESEGHATPSLGNQEALGKASGWQTLFPTGAEGLNPTLCHQPESSEPATAPKRASPLLLLLCSSPAPSWK